MSSELVEAALRFPAGGEAHGGAVGRDVDVRGDVDRGIQDVGRCEAEAKKVFMRLPPSEVAESDYIKQRLAARAARMEGTPTRNTKAKSEVGGLCAKTGEEARMFPV